MLKLVDGVLRVRADVISQHHEAQQVQVGHMALNLLLSHVQQAQLVHIVNGANCNGHQAEAIAAEVVSHLRTEGLSLTLSNHPFYNHDYTR